MGSAATAHQTPGMGASQIANPCAATPTATQRRPSATRRAGPCEAGRRRFHSAPRVPASATAMPIQPNPSHGSGPVMKGPAA